MPCSPARAASTRAICPASLVCTTIDQIVLDDGTTATEPYPLAPASDAVPIARDGDHFTLGDHELICDDADPNVLARLMGEDQARLLLTDEPYNVKISGHVTGGSHREFPMASGEMSDDGFRAFNDAWMAASSRYLCDGACSPPSSIGAVKVFGTHSPNF